MNPIHPPKSDADRLADEAAFHDQAFGQHVRKDAWKFYDVASTAYDRYAEALATSVSVGSTALEYGCGPGSHAFALARLGAIVDGIDISPVAIDLARRAAQREGDQGAQRHSEHGDGYGQDEGVPNGGDQACRGEDFHQVGAPLDPDSAGQDEQRHQDDRDGREGHQT